jgi:hypothetical protein
MRLAAGNNWHGGASVPVDPFAFRMRPHGEQLAVSGVLATAPAFQLPEMLPFWR